MVSRGYHDPRKLEPGKDLDKPFSDLFQQYGDADPPPRPQLALPVATVRWVPDQAGLHPNQPWLQAVADLITLAFFFLLRVGEYTTQDRETRTVPLRKADIRLWVGDTPLSAAALPLERQAATAVTISLVNQKNGHKDAIVHHTASTDPTFCPVRAAARRLDHLHAFPPDTPICTYLTSAGTPSRVRSRHIITAIRLAVKGTNVQGYPEDRVGSHSLRASGAMALKLNGYDDVMIMKLGRWTSNTYLRYIHSQIGALTANVASAMGRALHFRNVAV